MALVFERKESLASAVPHTHLKGFQKRSRRFEVSMDAQVAKDEKNQIIIGQHVSQNANDKKVVEPALEQIQETMGELPDKFFGRMVGLRSCQSSAW
jgi:hypothetical protein